MFGYNRRRISKHSSNVTRQRKIGRKFEQLEDRRLLTIFNVTTVADVVDPLDGKRSLREAIDLANANPGPDVIVLKAGPAAYKITIAGAGEDNNATGDFDITDDLTIKSAGSGFPTVSGNGLDRVFDIPDGFDGVALTLNHLIVTGGIVRGIGGGVAGESFNNSLTFIDTTIKNNVATSPGVGVGGGVYNDGPVTLINSHVDNNSAAAGVQGQGGGIFVEGSGNVTIKNSTINNNSAYVQGGGLMDLSSGVLTVTRSQINNNHSGDGGGGGLEFNTDNATFTNSSFSNNTTSGSGGAMGAGGSGEYVISKCTINNNSAVLDGGAIDAGIAASFNITRSAFANNTSTGGSGGVFGRVASVDATDSVFSHNVAQINGGVIDQKDSSGGITVLRSTFTNNAALTGTGGAINGADLTGTSRPFTFTDSKFTFNSAAAGGGAIHVDGEDITILRCTFDHNSVRDGNGGAIDAGANLQPINATDSKFTYNTSKANGSAIDSEGSDLTLLRCVFSCNTATNGEGGGFANLVVDVGHDVSITECTFDGNTAGGNGGGFSTNTDTFSMVRSTLSNNRSGSDGGGASIINNNTSAEIVNCTISGNGAANSGGGIAYVGNSGITITNCTIVFNASFTGGGISANGGIGMISMGNTIVAKNIATNAPDFNAPTASFNDQGHNLFFSILGIVDGVDASDIVGLDPKLGPLANNGGPTKTHALLKHSPAIDHGDNSLAPPTDQRGVKRPQGPRVDIGAYEKK